MKNNSEPVLENSENMKLVITFLSLVKCFSYDIDTPAKPLAAYYFCLVVS